MRSTNSAFKYAIATFSRFGFVRLLTTYIDASIDFNVIEPVDTFVHLGSLQSSDKYCWPDKDIQRRIRLVTQRRIHNFNLKGV